ncbi:exported protein of unknown function [Azospirillum baldaniorum]|uniref:ABC transporter type 1 GsiC-like N-terminal domain-containing protein n=1 Tax=Azospirillum baldaniorum TaxID=1064539 RepID=A0A9P1NL55_9PROT|nr:exported protein of unknown function [Azospirillum baldaniorum]
MLAFLVRRLLTLALTAWLATLVVFAVLEAIPGDPALVMLGTSAQPEAVAALRAQMGLDRPWPVRYAGWVGGMLHGDFGTSLTYARPVAGLVADRLAITLPLAGLALVLSAGIAIPLGPVRRRAAGAGRGLGGHGLRADGNRGARLLVRHPVDSAVFRSAGLVLRRWLPGVGGRGGAGAEGAAAARRGAGPAGGGDPGAHHPHGGARHAARGVCAHGGRQGPAAPRGPAAPCVAQRADPRRHHPRPAILLSRRRGGGGGERLHPAGAGPAALSGHRPARPDRGAERRRAAGGHGGGGQRAG